MNVHISLAMSIYSTPCQPNFDEETSGSEDSVYVTPEISSTDSVFNKYCSPLSYDECDRKSTKMHLLDSPVSVNNTRRKRKFKSDSVFDKENLKIPSLNIARHRKSDAGIPLKCVTTLFNTDQHLNEFQREKNLYSGFPEKSILPQIKKVNQRNIPPIKSTQSSLFQKMKIMQKLKSRCNKLNQSELSSDTETIVVKIPKTKSCGSISFENSKDIKMPQDQSERKSARTFSFAVLKKCRLVQLKRILTRPVSSIRSCYAKYLQKFRRKHYQPLHPLSGEDGHNFMSASEVQSKNLIETNKKTPSTSNIQELLHTVISKLSSMEREMKELKILVEENKNRGTVACYPGPPPPPLPPPPPPPPLPSNIFNHGTTPKRKVDLTTPENQQLAKRPSRIQEQRGQFSVTVEDLKNVKLKKIGNSKMNLGRNTIKEPMSLPLKRANASKFKRNSVVDQELSEKTAELFSPRSRNITTDTTLMGSPETTTVTSLNLNIYEQTPKRTKCRSTLFLRTGDLLNDPST